MGSWSVERQKRPRGDIAQGLFLFFTTKLGPFPKPLHSNPFPTLSVRKSVVRSVVGSVFPDFDITVDGGKREHAAPSVTDGAVQVL